MPRVRGLLQQSHPLPKKLDFRVDCISRPTSELRFPGHCKQLAAPPPASHPLTALVAPEDSLSWHGCIGPGAAHGSGAVRKVGSP